MQDSANIHINSSIEFEKIYNLHWEKVYLQCVNKLNDSVVAKDLTQDIFRSLWERYDDLIITVSIEHYLARATKFRILEHIRNESVKRKHDQALGEIFNPATNTTEDDLNYRELSDRLQSLIDFLPKQCKRVFTLSKIDGLSNKEISSELQITERTVEYHITRAYAFIRKNLKEFSYLFVFFATFVALVKICIS